MTAESHLDRNMSAYYAEGREVERLNGLARLEFVRTKELLARHLPAPLAVVLDVGGGPGAYALWLAQQGYRVHLLDPIELHVAQAREASSRQPATPLACADTGDARALSFGDATVDAVLALGPLYHLTDAADRRRALDEARRVLRPGGVLAAVGISRFASTIDGLYQGFLADPTFERIVERNLRDGRHENPERRPRWFTTAYFHLPDELADEVRAAGFRLEALLGIEGPAAFLADVDDWLDDPVRREALLRAIRRVETERTLLGASPHILAVATKPGRSSISAPGS
jgi:ubiquinone/menaquinone biosynthesis C-methylase UbiE